MSDTEAPCGVFQLTLEAVIDLLSLLENTENRSPALQLLVIDLEHFRATFGAPMNVYFDTPQMETGRS